MKIQLLSIFSLLLVLCFFSSSAMACACCAEPGTYSITPKKPGDFELTELKKIRFANADLFMTEAGDDGIKGVGSIGENYTITGLLQGISWKFNFKDEKGNSGALNLMKPTSMVAYMVDIHDRPQGDPVLYKEWYFKYIVKNGAGIFQKGILPATQYTLVLQGRGNMCTQAEDFTHWRLEIKGRKADYAFFGELKEPA